MQSSVFPTKMWLLKLESFLMEKAPPALPGVPGGEPGQENNRAELDIIFPPGRSFRATCHDLSWL